MVIVTSSSKLNSRMTTTPDPHELEALVHGEPATYVDIVRVENLAAHVLEERGYVTTHKAYAIEAPADGPAILLSTTHQSDTDATDVTIMLASTYNDDAELSLHFGPSGRLDTKEFPEDPKSLDDLDDALKQVEQHLRWDLQDSLIVQYLHGWMDYLQGRGLEQAPPEVFETMEGDVSAAEFLDGVVDERAAQIHVCTEYQLPIGDDRVLLLEQNDVFGLVLENADEYVPPLRIGIYLNGEDEGVSYSRDITGKPNIGPLRQTEDVDCDPVQREFERIARELSFRAPLPKEIDDLREALLRAIVLEDMTPDA